MSSTNMPNVISENKEYLLEDPDSLNSLTLVRGLAQQIKRGSNIYPHSCTSTLCHGWVRVVIGRLSIAFNKYNRVESVTQ